MFYKIYYENGAERHGEFNTYADALDYAENNNGGHDFIVEEFETEDDYLESL